MNREFYEKYYQKGGEYIIPTEIFNDLLSEFEKTKEQIVDYNQAIDNIEKIQKRDENIKLTKVQLKRKFIRKIKNKYQTKYRNQFLKIITKQQKQIQSQQRYIEKLKTEEYQQAIIRIPAYLSVLMCVIVILIFIITCIFD